VSSSAPGHSLPNVGAFLADARSRRQPKPSVPNTTARSRTEFRPDASLSGTWKAQRKIVDHLARATSSFEGTATLTPDRFHEEGHLTLGAARLHATRAYRLRATAQGVTVDFPDGSEFIALTRAASQKVRHVCGADTYVGHFFFVDATTWVEAWRVTGPRKHYASLTRYTALPSPASSDCWALRKR
jgi:hypothetical protein